VVRLTPADELFVHQIPEPLPNVAVHHEHWRESYFFVAHDPSGDGDVLIVAMAHYPAREEMDCLQLGRVGGGFVYARHVRPYGDDPHTTAVGPAAVEVVEPYRTVRLRVGDSPEAPVSLDLTFEARTSPYGLRRGTMKRGEEIVWDQSHMFQAGIYTGTYRSAGRTVEVDGWLGQRDHSWGIRDHARCPMWMWLAVQLPDAMIGVWHWELADGSRVYTDGCYAPAHNTGEMHKAAKVHEASAAHEAGKVHEASGAEPVRVTDFRHDLSWVDGEGRPVSYGRDGEGVAGLAGTVELTLAGGEKLSVEGEGTWAMPYGPLGGGQHLMKVRTSDGREGSAIYEVTGAHHHRYFPVPRAERLPG
jgi:hypothetical protein